VVVVVAFAAQFTVSACAVTPLFDKAFGHEMFKLVSAAMFSVPPFVPAANAPVTIIATAPTTPPITIQAAAILFLIGRSLLLR
jgi:hypothetical protein